ncbi:hypothetical protein EVAR_28085_1 [Eumeta japonica]|uniref:Uncharacterized protein n=1 Tax=Eumeta variegata TaxID=151549 RepID=A0A4C1WB22_EUMVA|nr:hypothetical protein EVAR_28085_1 [Eumeta japonica]
MNISHVLVHEFMSIYYALAGWSGNRERRDERTKRKREKEKALSISELRLVVESELKVGQGTESQLKAGLKLRTELGLKTSVGSESESKV